MRAVIVGMGVQGNKRKKFLGKDFVYSVDKFKKADFKSISEIPLNKFDTVFACVPDNQKLKIVNYCINNKKHILLEKPFIVKNNKILFFSETPQFFECPQKIEADLSALKKLRRIWASNCFGS